MITVIKVFRDLLNIALKAFNEKASCNGQKCQILAVTLRSPKKTMGHRQLHVDCGKLSTGKNCIIPYLIERSYPKCGHFGVVCPTLPVQRRPISPRKFLLPSKISKSFWIWQLKANVLPCGSQTPTTSVPNKATKTMRA